MRELRRRVEIGLLTECAIRGRPVKGPSLADFFPPDAICDVATGDCDGVSICPVSLTDVPRRRFR
jgi:hypothetical protein